MKNCVLISYSDYWKCVLKWELKDLVVNWLIYKLMLVAWQVLLTFTFSCYWHPSASYGNPESMAWRHFQALKHDRECNFCSRENYTGSWNFWIQSELQCYIPKVVNYTLCTQSSISQICNNIKSKHIKLKLIFHQKQNWKFSQTKKNSNQNIWIKLTLN